jgi:hypothetical protein
MATKTTKLDSVNIILSNIGQAPVTALDTGNPLVETAELVLDEINRTVQAEGWVYNSEYSYPLLPDVNGEILIPDNVLSMDLGQFTDKNVIQRRGKLYDRTNHTYKFEGQVELDLVWLEDFEDIPEAFKSYITVRAANVFAGRSVGSAEAVRFGAQEEVQARAGALEYDTQQGDYSMFSDSNNLQTYRAYRPVQALYRF